MIGIQVFQHGTRAQANDHLRQAADRVAVGGLFCVRVNSTDTIIELDHERIETGNDGSFTICYQAGPKTGLDIHFFTADELITLLPEEFTCVLAPRLHTTDRAAPQHGHWSQLEAILQRRDDT